MQNVKSAFGWIATMHFLVDRYHAGLGTPLQGGCREALSWQALAAHTSDGDTQQKTNRIE